MSLLDHPTSIFPTSAFPTVGPWCVALTRSNFEDRLAYWLLNHGIPYFLPMLGASPLFKGFIFLAPPPSHTPSFKPGHPGPVFTDAIRKSRCVCGFLFTANQPRLIQELTSLAEEPARSVLSRIPPGTKVKITGGTLQGLEGIVTTATNQAVADCSPEGAVADYSPEGAVAVKFELMNQWVPRSIPVSWIEPLL